MSDEEARIREALAADRQQPGELHDAAIRRAMRVTGAKIAASAGPRRRNFLGGAIAAGIVLIFGGAFLLQRTPIGDDVDVMRGGPANPVVILPADNAQLTAPPGEIRWPAQAGATSYLLTLRDGTGAVLWRAEPGVVTQLAVPQEVRTQLAPGNAYIWSVAVSGQAVVNELGPFVFHVR